MQQSLGVTAAALPWIAGYVLTVDDIAATRTRLVAGNCGVREIDGGRLLLEWPNAVSGFIVFQSAGAPLPSLA